MFENALGDKIIIGGSCYERPGQERYKEIWIDGGENWSLMALINGDRGGNITHQTI